jgi:hypothetical protein
VKLKRRRLQTRKATSVSPLDFAIRFWPSVSGGQEMKHRSGAVTPGATKLQPSANEGQICLLAIVYFGGALLAWECDVTNPSVRQVELLRNLRDSCAAPQLAQEQHILHCARRKETAYPVTPPRPAKRVGNCLKHSGLRSKGSCLLPVFSPA